MNILITGATGLVGKAILDICKLKGYKVHYLTTNKEKIENRKGIRGFYWNIKTQKIDSNCLDDVEAIINLAGASVSKKWTANYKNEIENSRIDTVRLLYKLLSETKHNVKYFSSASAMGIYPSSLVKEYDEKDEVINNTFLGNVVCKWEREVDKIRTLDIIVSKLRIGIVLSKDGGALPEMVKPINLGFGAAIASGKQYQSWIHFEDLARMFLYAVENKLSGSINAVASNPITNIEMTKFIARQLKKPIWLPNIPSFVIKIILGERAALILESQYLKNDKILNKGFTYKYDGLKIALDDCLKKMD